MLDHVCIRVRNFQESKTFFKKVLSPLGYALLMEPMEEVAGFGRDRKASFWLIGREVSHTGVHIAFSAENRGEVDTFYQAAMAAGGKDNGRPGVREGYHPSYYGAFVLDPDGNNIEAVCHKTV